MTMVAQLQLLSISIIKLFMRIGKSSNNFSEIVSS